jgi:peptidase M23-like protein
MSNQTPHISRSATRRTRASLAAFLMVATLSGVALQTAGAGTAPAGYPWPVKPFNRPHPIRGGFGDPRTLFHARPTEAGLMTGTGSFTFHWGVDIWAPNGTKVYPVVSGVVEQVSHGGVKVDAGHGRVFAYWHIRPRVSVGDHVQAGETNLGPIRAPFEHVHFSELQDRRIVNPLQAGHLTPYEDTTVPRVESIRLRRTDTGSDLVPTFVRGRVLLIAEAYDSPQMPVPGIWHGLPVAPALITWKLQRWDGKPIISEQVAADFRQSIPSNTLFWSYYARGTYQNMSVFDSHYNWGQPGCFLFKQTRTAFDTRSVKDGVYDLVVTATDIRGNHSSKSLRLTIHNRSGWVG